MWLLVTPPPPPCGREERSQPSPQSPSRPLQVLNRTHRRLLPGIRRLHRPRLAIVAAIALGNEAEVARRERGPGSSSPSTPPSPSSAAAAAATVVHGLSTLGESVGVPIEAGGCLQSSDLWSVRETDHEEKSGWRRSWEDQITELKRRSMVKDSEENLSWGARMRGRRAEASSAE
ncbi:unnamed protein product [Urochloa humidicola]